MNKLMILVIFFSGIFSVEIYWDLGVGITDFSPNYYIDDLQASTYHRVEGLKNIMTWIMKARYFILKKLIQKS